jgi:hypothetical protein
MKKITSYCLLFLFAALGSIAAFGQPSVSTPTNFTPGNIVILRVGDGTNALVNTGSAVFLEEYTPAGTLVQTLPIPATATTPEKALVISGTATSEGNLSLSQDGRALTLIGYDGPGSVSLSGTTASDKNRTVARVSGNGGIDIIGFTDVASSNNPRSVYSTDGNALWMCGGAGGIRYADFASTTSTQLAATLTNIRVLKAFNGQLYFSTSSGTTFRVGTVGTGFPVASGQTLTQLPGLPVTGSPYDFHFEDLDAGVAGLDVLYIADDAAAGGSILKYSLVGGTWTANGSIAVATARGLTGKKNIDGSVTLFCTNGAALVSLTDASGYNATMTGTPTVLVTAGTNRAFRGVAFAPTPCDVPVVTSITEQSRGFCSSSLPSTITFEVSATGAAPLTYQWYDLADNIVSDNADISGSQTATLTISGNFMNYQNPGFKCKVSNNCLSGNEVFGADMQYVILTDAPPVPTPFVFSTSTVTPGQEGVLFAAQDQFSATYTWNYTGSGFTYTEDANNSILADFASDATSGELQVTSTNACGNSPQGTLAITVEYTTEALTTFFVSEEEPCAGGDYQYSVELIADYTYEWEYSGSDVTITPVSDGESDISISFGNNATSGTLSVRATETGKLQSDALTLDITVKPLPAKPVITQSGNSLVSSASTGNQWYLSSLIINGETGQTLTPTQSGNYQVISTVDECVSPSSDAFAFTLSGPTSIFAASEAEWIGVYPNPASASSLTFVNKGSETLTLMLSDASGSVIFTADLQANEEKAFSGSLRPGLYLTQFCNTQNECISKKVIVE